MQSPMEQDFGRKPVRSGPSLRCPEYRRLFIWSFVLLLRMHLLSALLTVSSPFATRGWLMLLRRWFDRLKRDSADFRQEVRAWRLRQIALAHAAAASREFQNPWV